MQTTESHCEEETTEGNQSCAAQSSYMSCKLQEKERLSHFGSTFFPYVQGAGL